MSEYSSLGSARPHTSVDSELPESDYEDRLEESDLPSSEIEVEDDWKTLEWPLHEPTDSGGTSPFEISPQNSDSGLLLTPDEGHAAEILSTTSSYTRVIQARRKRHVAEPSAEEPLPLETRVAEIDPQPAEAVYSNEIDPQPSEAVYSNEIDPQPSEAVYSNEIDPQPSEAVYSNEILPRTVEAVGSNEILPRPSEVVYSNEVVRRPFEVVYSNEIVTGLPPRSPYSRPPSKQPVKLKLYHRKNRKFLSECRMDLNDFDDIIEGKLPYPTRQDSQGNIPDYGDDYPIYDESNAPYPPSHNSDSASDIDYYLLDSLHNNYDIAEPSHDWEFENRGQSFADPIIYPSKPSASAKRILVMERQVLASTRSFAPAAPDRSFAAVAPARSFAAAAPARSCVAAAPARSYAAAAAPNRSNAAAAQNRACVAAASNRSNAAAAQNRARAAAPTNRSFAPAATNRSFAPAAPHRSFAPAATNRSFAPAATNRSFAPAATNRSFAPAAPNRSWAPAGPTRSCVAAAPTRSYVAAAPTRSYVAAVPTRSWAAAAPARPAARSLGPPNASTRFVGLNRKPVPVPRSRSLGPVYVSPRFVGLNNKPVRVGRWMQKSRGPLPVPPPWHEYWRTAPALRIGNNIPLPREAVPHRYLKTGANKGNEFKPVKKGPMDQKDYKAKSKNSKDRKKK